LMLPTLHRAFTCTVSWFAERPIPGSRAVPWRSSS